MLLQEERELIVEYGKKMSAARLSTGTSGNISIYNAEKGLMAISPSGMDYFSTQPEDVVITDLEANIVDGARKPSSEWGLHTTFYKHKPQARAVVHTHSMYCTTFAVLGQPIRAVHYVIGDTGVATVPCAPYYPFGTLELAEAAIKVCGIEMGRTGMSEQDAIRLGIDYRTRLVTANDHPAYYPDATKLTIKLIYEARTRRLLGACTAGEKGAVMRADIFAVAIHAGMTTDELGMVDLAYAPPFAGVWDAVHIAANAAK